MNPLAFSAEAFDILLRLVAAALVGMVIGLNRDFKSKPMGMRTLSLVSLGAALVSVTAVHYPGMAGHADALSRVLQGIIQGIMAGVGFIGAGVILHDEKLSDVQNLTTAATVWVTAALGIACALAAWHVVWIGGGLTLLILLSSPLERAALRLLKADGARKASGDDVTG